MIRFRRIKILFILLFTLIFLLGFFSLQKIDARTVDDIQKEIDAKKVELDQINQGLKQAKNNLDSSQSRKDKAQGLLNKLKADIENIENQIEYNNLQIQLLTQSIALKELEIEERNKAFDIKLNDAYLYYKSEPPGYISSFFGSNDPILTSTYYDLITSNEQISLNQLALELNDLKEKYESFEASLETLQQQMTALSEEKKAKENEIAQINQQIANESAKLASIQNQANATRLQIEQLNEEQKALLEYEAWLLGQAGNGGTLPIVSGEFYFTGRGKDSVQGHGIGMSQVGSLGAALAGWNYKQILTFYYQNTTVVQYTERTTIPVQGYGLLDADTYVAGLGEVPSYGCENLGVPFGERGFWYCWPKEAIKAQVVAGRSYALSYTAGGYPICTSAACQVYYGGEAKQWAASETSYEVVAYQGQPIKAFYSANNNQGYGTANNDTIWSNRLGNGTAYPYLRSVNDNGFYYPVSYSGCGGDCSVWGYRTNSYTMAEIQSMFSWSIISPSTSITTGDREFLTGVLNDIGTLTSITFERDPSQRVKKVIVTGNKGSRYMAGWFFKSLWNIWVGNVKPSGEKDYIYSLTFYLLRG